MNEQDALDALRGDDPDTAALAEAALWTLWCQSGDTELDALLQQGVEAMEQHDYDRAETLFTRLVDRAPHFAEGWNKRATARYLAQDYQASIDDCEETLSRNPNHFGALSGQGLCHMALGDYKQAAALFMRTLAVYPHLDSARHNLATAFTEAVQGNGR